MRALTYALAQPEARDALASLAPPLPPEVVEALVEILARPHAAPLAPEALRLLAGADHPLCADALVQALDSPLVTVRLPAVEALARRGASRAAGRLARLLQEDDAWLVRRAVVRALAALPGPARWDMLLAADDPHWRVRHALINVLLPLGDGPAARADIDARLAAPHPAPGAARRAAHPRVEGVRAYLAARWTGIDAVAPHEERTPAWPFYDPDPAVVVRKLEEMGEAGRGRCLALLPELLANDVDRARHLAVETLRRRAAAEHIVAAVAQLDDPRVGAGPAVAKLLAGIDLDRIEEAARILLHADAPPAQLAWAIDQAESAFPAHEEDDVLRRLFQAPARHEVRVRRALARLAGRWPDAAGFRPAFLADDDAGVLVAALSQGGPLAPHEADRLLASPEPQVRAAAVRAGAPGAEEDADSRVRVALAERLVHHDPGSAVLARLQADPHPLVRAAALTPARAAELVAHPQRETSWHVLAAAARLQKTPLWRLEPQPAWVAAAPAPVAPEPLVLSPTAPPHARTLGPRRLVVPPVGVSGHYGLPVEGFVRAAEAGVNLFFWEPNYQTLTRFSARLSPAQRRQLHFLAGTFEATGAKVRKDVERALRHLQTEQLAVFLIFWTRSWERVTDEVHDTVERLQQQGLIGTAGLSTHSRPLAVEALAAGWDPVMVRHSAAHRGAESHVFPHAGPASLITFNNTCYGRLLRPVGDRPPPRPSDCYRYTLSFPQVTLCLTAPATLEQLEENLQVLADPALPEDRRRALLEQGADVYREETLFRRLVRSR
jgi:hypothetical protein